MSKKQNALPEATDKKPGKLFIIISYAIALASLLAVLFVPLYNGKMAIQLVWAACDSILSFLKINTPAFAYGSFFVDQSLRVYESAFILGIAVSTVLALIMLFPVIFCKTPQKTNLRCAFAAEFIAFLVVTANVLWEVLKFNGTWDNYAILIPFAVIMVVMATQSIKYKGGLGVAKVIIFILALLTAVTLLDITLLIPALEEPLKSFAGMIGAYNADVTFVGSTAAGVSNISLLLRILIGRSSFVDPANTAAFINQIISMVLVIIVGVSVLLDVLGLVIGGKTKKNGEPNPHKAWFIIAAVRYSAIIVLIAAMIALSFLVDGFGKVGIYMYFTAVLVLLTFVAEIIRYCVSKAKVKAYRKEQEIKFKNETIVLEDETLAEEGAEAAAEEGAEEGTEESAEPVAEEGAEPATEEAAAEQTNLFGDEPVTETEQVEEPVAEENESNDEQLTIMDAQATEEVAEAESAEPEAVEEAAEPVTQEESVEDAAFTLFGADQADEESTSIDPFIDKLTDEERAQFYDVFIHRNKGKFATIPAYEINGDNSDFFPSVFVHINRMRNICSDSLLAKIYKEISKD